MTRSSVYNFTTDSKAARAYSTGERKGAAGAGFEVEVPLSEIVIASDQLRVVQSPTEDSDKDHIMNDAEVQISGDRIATVKSEEFGIWDGKEQKDLKTALKDPGSLSVSGHKNLYKLLYKVADKTLEKGEAIQDDGMIASLTTWKQIFKKQISREKQRRFAVDDVVDALKGNSVEL